MLVLCLCTEGGASLLPVRLPAWRDAPFIDVVVSSYEVRVGSAQDEEVVERVHARDETQRSHEREEDKENKISKTMDVGIPIV